ncbi:MAG: energy-coupling factor transporter ATPase [Spirochaetota bacterium]
MGLIEFSDVSFSWPGSGRPAVDRLSLDIGEGEYLAIVGRNGSGKSSLLRLMTGLRVPDSGNVRVAGLDASNPDNWRNIRSSLALVFQSPSDQVVSTVVEEDVAFGPENLGLSRSEIGSRVDEALAVVGLSAERRSPPHFLSAGQQQRLAVAGALAMRPRCIAFDEATAMLDPPSRLSILSLMDRLNDEGVTIIHVTHDMTEAVRAHRIIRLESGKIAFDGGPQGFLQALDGGPGFPPAAQVAREAGLAPIPGEAAKGLAARMTAAGAMPGAGMPAISTSIPAGEGRSPDPAFALEAAGYAYLSGTAMERRALRAVSYSQPRGSLLALVGHTGSGKSTVLQLLNALSRPSEGRVLGFGKDPAANGTDLRKFRMRAPLAIQRPESALFEQYAGDDVAFGPRNQGLSGEALVARVRGAMERVGLRFEDFRDRPSRALSGGERRRLALAGVLALAPEGLLLDEPTQALDPEGRETIIKLLLELVEAGSTLAFSTHSMEEAALADIVAILRRGELVAFGPPDELFGNSYQAEWGVGRPFAFELASELARQAAS